MTEHETRRVRTSLILEPTHRLRESIDGERLGALADDMAAQGQLQPIGLRGPLEGERWEIIWGHRRFLAAQLLRWPTIEAKLYPADFDPLLAAVAENNNREEMTPLDEARALHRFVERGEPLAAIARLWRRSAHWVEERLALLELPEDLMNVVHDRELPLAVVRALADIDHADYRASLIAEAKRTGANSRTVEVWAAHYRADRERIVQNHLTVAEIAATRENWKLMIPCELCGDDVEYTRTRSIRGCVPCLDALAQLIDEKAREAVAEAERSSG